MFLVLARDVATACALDVPCPACGLHALQAPRCRSSPSWSSTGESRSARKRHGILILMPDEPEVSPVGSIDGGESSPIVAVSGLTPPSMQTRPGARAFMEQAVALARQCVSEEGRISPKVGAVVVREGVVLGEAFRGELAPGDHAEYTLSRPSSGTQRWRVRLSSRRWNPARRETAPRSHAPKESSTAGSHASSSACSIRTTRSVVAGNSVLGYPGIEIVRFDPDLMAQIEELNREFTRQQRGAQHSVYTPHGVGNLTPSAFSRTSKRERLVKLPEAAPISDADNFSHVQSVQPGLERRQAA